MANKDIDQMEECHAQNLNLSLF